jgi:hypothetical protein
MLFSGFIKSIKALTKGSMSLSEKFHIVYAAGIGILLIIYVFVLLSTVVATAGELLKPLTPLITAALGDASNPTLEYIQSLLGSLLPYLQVLAVISLGLGLFSLKSPRQLVGETSVAFMSTTDYLAKGEIRSDLTDQVYSLLQHVHAKKDVRYQRIHIFAYSFGSIIAIDAVFPSGEPAHWTRNIDTLVTIGCPFDFVRTYWDDYFEYRHSLDGVPREWLNVYVTADVWATDFDPPDRKRSRPTKRGGPRTEQRGIVLETGSKKPPNDNIRLGKDRKLRDYFLSWFTLIGIRLHYSYWGKKNPHVENCFDLIVPKVYKGDHAPTATCNDIDPLM